MIDDEEENYLAERPNKTQLKREMLALRDLGKQLVALSPAKLADVPLPEDIQDAVVLARRLKKSALKRQFIYIEKLMRNLDDVAEIRNALEMIHQPHKEEVEKFHQLEAWRDRLIAGDNELLNELVAQYEQADRQYLRQLVRNANRELGLKKPPKSSRVLFQYLADLQRSHP